MKRFFCNFYADYRWWLREQEFDDLVLVPLGAVVLVTGLMFGLWLLVSNPDVGDSLLVALVCGYFMRPLWHRLRRDK